MHKFFIMSNIRFKALELSFTAPRRKFDTPQAKISNYYGDMAFNKSMMQEYLTREAFDKLMMNIEQGDAIDRKTADQIASGMKAWAISKGATHYTHWFHPLTGASAEKHDAFINPIENGHVLENFMGSDLIQQEPDASSFPSGGLRNTFEARGYTAWDPTSYAFIMDQTLCIPTIFVSYTGEALDNKTPLLKSLSILDKAATQVCKLFDRRVTKVTATLGWEQEYFLVDRNLYLARPDLVLTGRTLFGHASAKDQQLSDHYFGTIHSRVKDYMKEVEFESHRLGIPVKTRHNEVAPNQFECAPVYEEANLATDHNQLLMHLLEKVAHRHGFEVLLHEKPFKAVNGSGKHNNWSLQTNTGINLLSPGKTLNENFRFLTILVNIIKAVHDHADILRASIANAGNDHRLGANEAPPAIISVFIGSQLTKSIEQIEKSKQQKDLKNHAFNLNINIPKIPEILLDNTDRNRTSPFAFTGNKFEFRAVGSSANCAHPMIALNTIVAQQFNEFKKDVESKIQQGTLKNEAIFETIKEYIKDSKAILFEGNNYSSEWEKEAAKRGLSNIKSTPHSLEVLLRDEAKNLYELNEVLSSRELEARFDIEMENYTKKIQIESRVAGDLARNHIIPTAIRYQSALIENVKGLKEVLENKKFQKIAGGQLVTIETISEHVEQINHLVMEMTEERKKANALESNHQKALAYNEKVKPYLDEIRYHSDKLELMVDDELWPLPKYRELLFIK